jgi:hypothetical protein
MKKQLLLLLTAFILITGCKKNTADEGLSATDMLNILTANPWLLSTGYGPGQLSFLANTRYGQYGGEINFGQPSPLGPGFSSASTDSFSIVINNGIAYLNVTDNVAAISLTNRSTYYQITSISSSGFTLAPPNQAISSAPSFPLNTLTYYKRP